MKRIPEVDSQWENRIPLEFIFVRTILFCHSIKRKDYFVTNLMLPFQRQVVKMLMVVQYFIKKKCFKVYSGASRGDKCFNAMEAETRAIIHALKI